MRVIKVMNLSLFESQVADVKPSRTDLYYSTPIEFIYGISMKVKILMIPAYAEEVILKHVWGLSIRNELAWWTKP